jgi:hypothetical protein
MRRLGAHSFCAFRTKKTLTSSLAVIVCLLGVNERTRQIKVFGGCMLSFVHNHKHKESAMNALCHREWRQKSLLAARLITFSPVVCCCVDAVRQKANTLQITSGEELHLFSFACPQAREEELLLRKRELEERRNSLDSEQVRSLSMALDKVLFVRLLDFNFGAYYLGESLFCYTTHRSQVVIFFTMYIQ